MLPISDTHVVSITKFYLEFYPRWSQMLRFSEKLGHLPRPSVSRYFWWLAFVHQPFGDTLTEGSKSTWGTRKGTFRLGLKSNLVWPQTNESFLKNAILLIFFALLKIPSQFTQGAHNVCFKLTNQSFVRRWLRKFPNMIKIWKKM